MIKILCFAAAVHLVIKVFKVNNDAHCLLGVGKMVGF